MEHEGMDLGHVHKTLPLDDSDHKFPPRLHKFH